MSLPVSGRSYGYNLRHTRPPSRTKSRHVRIVRNLEWLRYSLCPNLPRPQWPFGEKFIESADTSGRNTASTLLAYRKKADHLARLFNQKVERA
ncbi:hypothetical protein C8N36_1366 [Pelagimonas varians]|uniref:Uncharacterized protein n=1 Tax=Pelagimonas varians TaxID=696760 RepID=A0A238KBR9_9RHOB|nr:hypothetical protein C8N36_1366 [Pelagimonas varians]SMX39967.1 hypothetical protein PEV8663_01954 [Pelagimonas varians]